jgi:hypothetical protein
VVLWRVIVYHVGMFIAGRKPLDVIVIE